MKWSKEQEAEWLMSIPPEAWMMALAKRYGGPVSLTVYEKALEQKPEWFPEEVEHKRKWALIPQEVHDQYLTEIMTLDKEQEVCRDSKYTDKRGMMHWIEHQQDYNKWTTAYEECRTELDIAAREKEIHTRYYGPYGIEYCK